MKLNINTVQALREQTQSDTPDLMAAGSLLLTEADLALMDKVEQYLPGLDIQAVRGPLNLHLVRDKEAITALWITVRSSVGGAEMESLPNLRVIVTASAGYDHIDLAEAKTRGITVCHVPSYGPAVAEFNIALMLALSRKLHRGYLQTLQDEFALDGLLGRNLNGKTLGVIGAGNIGQKVLELAGPFGLRLLATDPEPRPDEALRVGFEYVPLIQLLRQSDIIAICCPLNSFTHHLIGRRQFEIMKHGVLIVNTSRGAVIDSQDLLWALSEDIVGGAALDVLEAETLLTHDRLTANLGKAAPLETVENIAEDLTLMRHPKVIVTPHMAYFTEDSLDSITAQTAQNIRSFFDGKPRNVVG